ncbi:MAG: hypothetical protein GX800_11475 [Clostridiaceae bacterium]|jgi:hypothetical protein|nr:hypothetical protein [Clostridiaceae bacterium]
MVYIKRLLVIILIVAFIFSTLISVSADISVCNDNNNGISFSSLVKSYFICLPREPITDKEFYKQCTIPAQQQKIPFVVQDENRCATFLYSELFDSQQIVTNVHKKDGKK